MSVTTWDADAVITCKSITASSSYGLADGANIATGTTTGTIIAATAAQKLGFWGTVPIVQPTSANQAVVAALTDNSGGASGGNTISVVTDNASAANAIATLAAALRLAAVNSGLIKGS